MLGKRIIDGSGADGEAGVAAGLGLLNIETVMSQDKTVRPVTGTCSSTGTAISGYEIHVGETSGPDCIRPMLSIDGVNDGARSPHGLVEGTYVHGLMADNAYRSSFLKKFGLQSAEIDYSAAVDDALDELADRLESALDIINLLDSASSPSLSDEIPANLTNSST